MKNRLLFLLILLFVFSKFSFGQDFHWVKSFGSELNDYCNAVAIDKYGNTYAAGTFGYLGMIFPGGSYYLSTPYLLIEGDTLFNNGFDNMFLAKYDLWGNLLWAKSIGGWNTHESGEGSGGLVYDPASDHIYFSGCGTGQIKIGSVIINCSNSDVFLAKFDLNGNCLWGKNFLGAGDDGVCGMCIDTQGNVYLTGINDESMTIQSITVEKGEYIAKFNSSGTCIWAKKEFPLFSGSASSTFLLPTSIKENHSDIIFGGYTNSKNVIIDTLSITDTNYNGSYDYYAGILAKFDSVGNVKWGKYFGSPCSFLNTIDCDNVGNIFNAGYYGHSNYYDSARLDSAGSFLAKCDSSGNLLRIKKTGSYSSYIQEIQIDKYGNCFASGYSNDVETFGGTTFTTKGTFTLKFSPAGEVEWARQVKGGSDGPTKALTVNPEGSIIVIGGSFSHFISIDSSITINNTDTNIYGTDNVFLVRYDGSSGIKENNAKIDNSLHIYSNPTSGIFAISVPVDFLNENTLILTIFNSLGSTIHQEKIKVNGDNIEENLKHVSKGCYTVTLTNGLRCFYGKVIII